MPHRRHCNQRDGDHQVYYAFARALVVVVWCAVSDSLAAVELLNEQ